MTKGTNTREAVESVDTATPVPDAPGGLLSDLEAILMVADSPVSAEHLARVLQVPVAQIRQSLAELARDYTDGPRPRGFELREAGGGWRVYSARSEERRGGREWRAGGWRSGGREQGAACGRLERRM